MRTRTSLAVDLAALACATCVIVLTVAAVRGRPAQPVVGDRSPILVPDWLRYAEGGHRTGGLSPKLLVIEFGDYECPACRRFHAVMEDLLAAHGDDIGFVYRHWPLESHAYAYDAARAAECAAAQGVFWEYHKRLYEDPRWINDAFLRFARDAGVPDEDTFMRCARSTAPVEAIEDDIETIRALDAFGTPAVIANGRLFWGTPSKEDLEALMAVPTDP